MIAFGVELTRRKPLEWAEMRYRWPLERLLVYLEDVRVRSFFDEIEGRNAPFDADDFDD